MLHKNGHKINYYMVGAQPKRERWGCLMLTSQAPIHHLHQIKRFTTSTHSINPPFRIHPYQSISNYGYTRCPV